MAWQNLAKHWKRRLSTLLAGTMVLGLVSNAAVPQEVSAAPVGGTPVPVAEYDFAGDFTDSRTGSQLSLMDATYGPYGNTTSAFGVDGISVTDATYWAWTSTETRGGGFHIDVNDLDVQSNYSIALRFSYDTIPAGYAKIIDYENTTTDKGFYLNGGRLNFYTTGNAGTGTQVVSPGHIVDVVVTRDDATKKFTAYTLVNGAFKSEFEITDSGNAAVPAVIDGKLRFGFFHDDTKSAPEKTDGGKVYSIKIWDVPLTEAQVKGQVGIPTPATGAPGGVNDGLISWVDVERSTDENNKTTVKALTDLQDSSRKWENSTGLPYSADAINFNGGVEGTGRYFVTAPFGETDTEREVFSVQTSKLNSTANSFPWDLGSGVDAASTYGDANGQGNIVTRFGTNVIRTVGSNGIDLKRPRLLNIAAATNDWSLSIDGRKLATESSNSASFERKGASGYYLGAGHHGIFRGDISEVIVYDHKLTDTERAKVNSYLALKYGLTLKKADGTSGDYVFSNGNPAWAAANHAGYTNRVTAIAKDSGSGLVQKQSKSQEEGAKVAIAAGNLAATNAENPTAIPADYSALVISDNNGAETYTVPAGQTNDGKSIVRMDRVYKVGKTSNWTDQAITIQLEGATADTHLLVNTDPGFAGTSSYVKLTDGKVTVNSSDLPNGSYFTFAELKEGVKAPGGVAGGLHLWLRADNGVEANVDGAVYGWADKSGNGRDFEQTNNNYRPAYNTDSNLLNFNRGVTFDGSNDHLGNAQGILGSSSYADVNVFAVAGVGPRQQTSLFWEGTGNPGDPRFQVHLPWSNGAVYWDAGNATGNRVSTPAASSEPGKYNIWGFTLSPDGQSIERDGKSVVAANESRSPLQGASQPMTVGSAGGTTSPYRGQLGDFIVYTGPLNETQKQQIQSYLALKYGISLDGVPYRNASGAEVWTASGDYNTNIAGIARDDAQGLHQKQSRSMNDATNFTVSLGTLAASNEANTNSLNDQQFLVWGDNGKSLQAYSAAIQGGDGAVLEPAERVWKAQNTNGVGAVELSVDKTAFAADVTAADLRFITANDATFAGAAEFEVQERGAAFVVSGVTLGNGSHFTFAKRSTGQPFIDLLRPDVQNYAENDGVIRPAPNTVIWGGGVYSDGYLKYEIEGGSTSGETLSLVASETPNRDAGAVSVVGGKVYLGYGQDQEPRVIGSVNTDLNGNGKALQIDLSTPLTNGDFSKGTEGWTVSNNRVVLGALASKTQGRAGISATGTKAPYTITGQDADGQPYTFLSDVPYGTAGKGAGTKFEGKETFTRGTFKHSTTGQYLTLESNGTAPNSGSSYGSMFGPEAVSDVFEARAGDTLAFDWSAQGGSDDYEIYGFLIKVNDNGTTTVAKELMYGRGKSQPWTTASGTIPEDGRYQFRFVAGSYDQSGGYALGAKLLIDNVRVFNSDVTAEVVQKLAGLVTYENRPFPRPLKKQDRLLKATVQNAEGNSASDQMTIHLLGDMNYATPGGVSAENLSLWLRGDKDVTVDNSAVTGWGDQAGVNKFTAVGTPDYNAGAANFNPAVTFANTAGVTENPNEYLTGDRAIDYKDGFAVFKHRGGAAVGSATPAAGGYGVGLFASWNNYLWAANGAYTTRHGFKFNDSSRYHLAEIDLANPSQGYLSGQAQSMSNLKTINGIQFVPVIGGTFGGGNASNWNHYNGELAEVILFSNNTTADEKRRIESYLALKYGMTLKNANGTSKDYVSSYNPDTSSDTPIWTASSNAGYGHRITGIGRDDKSALTQKQSKSQEAGALVTIAAGGAIEASNAANASEIPNLAFFTFSDDNGNAAFTGTIPEAAGHNLLLMDRKFKTQSVNWPSDAAITLQLDVTDTAALHYLVVYDSNGQPKIGKLTDGKITVAASSLPNGSVFTFAKVQKEELNTKITGAKQLTPTNYTPASWQKLQEQITAAEAVLISPTATQVEVDTALAALQQAINELGSVEEQVRTAVTAAQTQLAELPPGQYTEGSVKTFENALAEAKQLLETGTATPQQLGQVLAKLEIAKAGLVNLGPLQTVKANIEGEQLNPTGYTEASWQALQTALNVAAAVLANPNATQAEVDEAKAALEVARAGLIGVNKAPLQAEVNASEELVAATYTPASWTNLENALDTAKAVLENPNATQAEVDTALANLQKARSELVKLGPALIDLGNTEGLGLVPGFDGEKYRNYEAVVANAVYSVNLQPMATDGHTIKLFLNGQEVADPNDWSNLPLNEGANEIRIVVTAPDGTTQNEYFVRIYRATGKLVSLTPSEGLLNPSFRPELYNYDQTVMYQVESVKLTPVSLDPQAVIEIGLKGKPLAQVGSGEASAYLPLSIGENMIVVRVTDRLGEVTEYTVKVVRQRATPGSSGNVGGGGGTTTPSAPGTIDTTVNGTNEPFATGTTTTDGGRTHTNVKIDPDKLNAILEESNGQKLAIRVPDNSDVTVDGLTAELVKRIADTGSTLEFGNTLAIYPVPGEQLDLGDISQRLGDAGLGEIDVHVDIKRSPEALAQAAEAKAEAGGYELLVPPVDLKLTFSHDGQSVQAGQLDGYAARYIALPDGIDPNRITTGVVVNPDGTIFHLPTVVTKINERYFAMINDLRDSGTYSVIWNPQDFSDVRTHWARTAVNNIAARLSLAGTGNNTFSPDRDITRSEFASIVALGMGLMRQNAPASEYPDVGKGSWYHDAITIASEFGIVLGFDDGLFHGDLHITREQGIAMIGRAYALVRPDESVSEVQINQALSGFNDADEVSFWAREVVARMVRAGIVEGEDGLLLNPQENMTRAETAALMQRLLKMTGLIDS